MTKPSYSPTTVERRWPGRRSDLEPLRLFTDILEFDALSFVLMNQQELQCMWYITM